MAHGMTALPAEAHRRHRHRHVPQRSYVVVRPFGIFWGQRQPKVRISDNCVWKPWKQQTVCRY